MHWSKFRVLGAASLINFARLYDYVQVQNECHPKIMRVYTRRVVQHVGNIYWIIFNIYRNPRTPENTIQNVRNIVTANENIRDSFSVYQSSAMAYFSSFLMPADDPNNKGNQINLVRCVRIQGSNTRYSNRA